MEITKKTIDEIDWSKEEENMRLVEAIFFISGRFLSMQDLISLSNLNSLVIKESIEKIKEKYQKENSAIEIVERDNLWKMDVKQEYHNIINKIATGSIEFSKAEQETLAIIAYKQPIKQSIIIKIRGNKAYDHVHKFIQLDLIKAKKEGHTNILTLSEEFYDYFNVSDENKNPLKEETSSDEEED
ncbi:SMC-Scp complex subunit ScpB [Candidatus Pacearchaeota archaeon CG10_big_fil_rev_8_21_14_0_10_32_42]|nr:MAG: SMC-Scp complex subunit ScpB [Candidatus Pacearchaeota archaeon CG10_big_fil_rev_8_21_14_0_10_32_42]